MATIIQTQPASLTAVPGQNSTFSVVASSDFSAIYTYQWKLSSGLTVSTISGATSSTYVFDPLITDSGKKFLVQLSALSGATVVATLTSNAALITVIEDVKPFDVYDLGTETGRERHRRLHLLGYI